MSLLAFTLFLSSTALAQSSSQQENVPVNPLGGSKEAVASSLLEPSSLTTELEQPKSESTLRFGIVVADKTISCEVLIPYLESKPRNFAVQIPYKLDGEMKTRTEVRVQNISLSRARFEKRSFVLSRSNSQLTDLKGQRVDLNNLAVGQRLLVLDEGQSITELHRRVLKDSLLVLKLDLTEQQTSKLDRLEQNSKLQGGGMF